MQRKWAILIVSWCVFSSAPATETANYTYDVFGRLRKTQITGGPADSVQRTFDYDATNNRTQIQVSGASSTSTFSISPINASVNETSIGIRLGVRITGGRSPSGIVTFTKDSAFIGSTYVIDGEARIILEGFSLGQHTITASYSGDGINSPYSHTFTIKVHNLSWLPAVLDVVLSD